MDLHASFNVSKNTIETLSRKGYVEEVWGPRNIGVRFQLTEKGKRHLERLRLAAKLKKDEMEKAAIRLKRRGP